MKLTSLAIICLLMTGCSLYESDGRKYIEQGGITFYNKTKASFAFAGCSTEAPGKEWVPFEKTDRGELSSSESEAFDLLAAPTSATPYNCLFHFASAQEIYENSSDAMEFCLHQSPAGCHR